MIVKDIKVSIEKGLHARPAADLVKNLNKFQSSVEFKVNEKKLNPKSVISLMASVIKQGDVIRVNVNGLDEEETMNWLVNFL
jgi:catabolite repression HPr-like protein